MDEDDSEQTPWEAPGSAAARPGCPVSGALPPLGGRGTRGPATRCMCGLERGGRGRRPPLMVVTVYLQSGGNAAVTNAGAELVPNKRRSSQRFSAGAEPKFPDTLAERGCTHGADHNRLRMDETAPGGSEGCYFLEDVFCWGALRQKRDLLGSRGPCSQP